MKEKLVAKANEHIERLLEKPELTNEEYFIIHERLMEIKRAEEDAARKIETEEYMGKIAGMLSMGMKGGGICAQ